MWKARKKASVMVSEMRRNVIGSGEKDDRDPARRGESGCGREHVQEEGGNAPPLLPLWAFPLLYHGSFSVLSSHLASKCVDYRQGRRGGVDGRWSAR